jgi:putative ABC transport system permease protein
MINLSIPVRNLLRNRRRTIVTMLSIVVGTVTMLIFGGFISSISFGMQTNIVRQQGHLHIMPQDYFEHGPSRPGELYIEEYEKIIEIIKSDSYLSKYIRVITPILRLSGIAGNYPENSSKTFIGIGLIPSQQNEMRDWDPYKLNYQSPLLTITDNRHNFCIIGYGMARMLNLCDELSVPECNDSKTSNSSDNAPHNSEISSLKELVSEDISHNNTSSSNHPEIDFLSTSSGGAPNVLTLNVLGAQQQGTRELDNSYVVLNLSQAQNLIYGGEKRISSIVLQLYDSSTIDTVQSKLNELLNKYRYSLEIKRFSEINQMYERVMAMFGSIFTFIAIVISLIVIFTVINTMTMNVMERTTEIGTLRALGMRRNGIRRLFVNEGAILGIASASIGVFIATIIATILNNAGIMWTPPSNAAAQPLRILVLENPELLISVWILLVFVTTFSAFLSSRRAANMNIVNAIQNI